MRFLDSKFPLKTILCFLFNLPELNTKHIILYSLLILKGASIRLDTTLVDFTEMRWERGDITFLYRGDAASPEESLYVLDNQLRVYQKVL